jgi:peptidoglycan/xylan/chitin deacetylase (PgdA/CDA1 family)
LTTSDSPRASDYPRDLIGYGRHPPDPQWPGGARIALQFVLNYEEGGENSVLHGDAASEQFLSEIVNAAAYPARHLTMESLYEYGSRAGVWRILREFEKRRLPLTVFAVSMALQRHPDSSGIACGRARDRLPRLAVDPLPGSG